MSWSICMHLLKKFHKVIRGIFIPQYGLQKLKVSRDLEKVDVNVVETPWITPYVKTAPINKMYIEDVAKIDRLAITKNVLYPVIDVISTIFLQTLNANTLSSTVVPC